MERREKLRFLRLKKNYTIHELARILEISPAYLGAIERGTRPTNLKMFRGFRDIIENLPRRIRTIKNKFFLIAQKYNRENPIEGIESEPLRALLLLLNNPRLLNRLKSEKDY